MSWPAATSWASPRPARARPRPSRCRSCIGSRPSGGSRMPHSCRVLVLAPTRELASQIEDSFQTYGRNLRLSSTVVFGGVDMRRQQRIMARGVDVLVATPGRLVDHLGQRSIRLDRVEVVVLDEVDRMLDIGFIHAIRRVMSHVPKQRQSLFFSATLPKDIAALAAELLKDPATVKVIPATPPPPSGSSSAWSMSTRRPRRRCSPSCWPSPRSPAPSCSRAPSTAPIRSPAICSGRASRPRPSTATSRRTTASGRWPASRTAPPRCWWRPTSPRAASTSTASATSSTSTCPTCAETYVHRIGRTARAGAQGLAIAFCSADENGNWRAIEALIRQRVPVLEVEGNRSTAAAEAAERSEQQRRFIPRGGRPAGSPGREERGHNQRPTGSRPVNGRGPQSSGPRRGGSSSQGQRSRHQAAH